MISFPGGGLGRLPRETRHVAESSENTASHTVRAGAGPLASEKLLGEETGDKRPRSHLDSGIEAQNQRRLEPPPRTSSLPRGVFPPQPVLPSGCQHRRWWPPPTGLRTRDRQGQFCKQERCCSLGGRPGGPVGKGCLTRAFSGTPRTTSCSMAPLPKCWAMDRPLRQ